MSHLDMMAIGGHASYCREVLLKGWSKLVHELFVTDPC